MDIYKKVSFLYLYPIKKFYKPFYNNEEEYLLLRQCINKIYRENGYEIVYAMYPDKEAVDKIFDKKDKVILTDVKFSELKEIDQTDNEIYRSPNEIKTIDQLDDPDELAVDGFHYSDCVIRVTKVGLSMVINSIVDLDLTDLFFIFYKDKKYFEINKYNFERFRQRFYRHNN